MRRRILINLAVFAGVAVLFIYWAATNIVSVEFIERPFRVTGDFENAMGVLPSAEVTYLGTQAGLVDTIDRIPGGVRITMKINRGQEIPRDAPAHIWRKSALGEQYIDFTNPAGFDGDGPFLKEGDHVPRERTAIPIEFADMLRAADTLVGSIDPGDLRTVTHELATGLQGRTDDLRSLIVEGDRLAATFAERTEALDRLATNNTRLTRVFAAHSGSLASALEDLRAVSDTLVTVADDLGPLVDDGTELFGDLAPVVHDHRDSLACLLDAVDDAVDLATTPARLAGLKTLLVDAPTGTDNLKAATDIERDSAGREHQWVRVDLVDDADDPADDFVPNRAVPSVPTVGACSVSFASVDPSEADAATPGSGVTPATGAGLTAATGLGLLVLVALARRAGPAVPD
ncbi:MAG: MCE family protein [Actinobacteria bacterium]|nr:MCE family protein [Actinomycetota bacterium]